MNTNVTVVENPQTGLIWTPREIVDSQTGEKRTVAVIQLQQLTVNDSGIGGLSKRTAFKTYEMDVVKFLETDENGNHSPLVNGQKFPIPGQLVVEETLTPYVSKSGKKQEPKRRGKGGAIITYQGKPVYRNTEFTTDMSAQDVFLRENSVSANAPAAMATEEANAPE